MKATPILMLTARDTLSDKLKGFEAGADDYLVKPFALEELAARLDVLARRSDTHEPTGSQGRRPGFGSREHEGRTGGTADRA